jgi:hypothetical protein
MLCLFGLLVWSLFGLVFDMGWELCGWYVPVVEMRD